MLVLVIVQIVVFTCGCFAKELLPNIRKCHADDPKVGECIAKAANQLRPYIRKGIKELGIPSFEPFHIATLAVNQTSNLVNYSIDFWNYTASGLDNYDLTEITFNPKSMTFKVTLQFDPVLLKSAYRMSGTLLDFPVEGIGNVQFVLGPTNGTFEMNGDMVKRRNLDYYTPKDLKIRLDIDDLSAHLDGLFPNNPTLGELTNNMINQHSKLLARALTPSVETLSERLIIRYFKWLAKTFSYNQLFPPSQAI